MARKSTESKSVSFEVVVELKELEKGQRLPNLAAYAFSPCGRFLAKQPLKPDPKKSGIGRAKFTIDTELDHLLVKVGVNVDDYRAAERHRAIANNLLVKEKKILDFEIPKDIWRCWLYVLYVITGTVTKPEGGWYNPICVGEVDVYEVDVKKCLIRLDDYLIEKIRDGLIDIIENPPREIEGFPPDIPWPSNGNDDDGWCGTKPPKPFPPRLVDVIKKLESLPSEWAFAKDRYIGLPTARTRMDAALNEMAVAEKRAYLDSEAAEGVKVSQILYTNTTQFRHLLVEKFQVLKYYLCWYPWIYWIWWPYCSYSAEKLGTTKLKMDGSFSLGVYLSVCEDDKPDLWFLVRQKISGIERIIYARYPVPCNTYWNHPSGKPVHLVVYDPEAVVCHPPPDVNIPGYWVMPMGIYEDEWWQVHQAHLSTACVPGTPLPSQCGLYNQTDPYGTRLDLRMEFHPGLRNCISATNGARYYRWSYRKHGNTTWIPINTHISHRYVAYIGSDWFIEREDMGPHTVGGKDNLFLVPDQRPWLHNRDDLACAIWYTAIWDSTLNRYVAQVTDGKYDLQLEMFDKNGNKLKPTTAGFKFCLPTSATGIVNDSLYVESDGSLILHVHVDNLCTIAEIDSITLNNIPTQECQFLEYLNVSDNVEIKYLAYHQHDFLKSYNLTVRRGIHGTNVASMSSSTPAPSLTTKSYTAEHLLRKIGSHGPFEQCAFAVYLHTYPRTRDGHGTIRAYENSDTSAFALVRKKIVFGGPFQPKPEVITSE